MDGCILVPTPFSMEHQSGKGMTHDQKKEKKENRDPLSKGEGK